MNDLPRLPTGECRKEWHPEKQPPTKLVTKRPNKDDAVSPEEVLKVFPVLKSREGVESLLSSMTAIPHFGCGATASGGATITAGEKSAESLTNESQAIGMALKLADTLTARLRERLKPQRSGFELARLMVGHGFAGPGGMESVAEAFAERCGFTLAAVWGTFENGWYKVKSPVGNDAFDELARQALAFADALSIRTAAGERVLISPDPGRAYFHVAVLAWLLQEVAPGPKFDFIFATTRIGRAFGWHASTAADAVKILADRGVIVCTDAKYSLPGGKAKKFRFVGTVSIGGKS